MRGNITLQKVSSPTYMCVSRNNARWLLIASIFAHSGRFFYNAKQNVFIAYRKQLKKTFAVARYGIEKAKRLAIQFRRRKEAESRFAKTKKGCEFVQEKILREINFSSTSYNPLARFSQHHFQLAQSLPRGSVLSNNIAASSATTFFGSP